MLTTDVNIANTMFEEKFNHIMNTEAPMKTVQFRTNYSCWLSEETKEEMIARDKARQVAKTTNLDADWDEYKLKRNNCTKKQRLDKVTYYRTIFDGIEAEKDTAKLFKMTKRLLGQVSAGPPNCLTLDGRPTYKQKEIADIQVNHYYNKVNKLKHKLPQVNIDPLAVLKSAFSRWDPAGGKPVFSMKTATVPDIFKMIMRLMHTDEMNWIAQ